MSKNRFFAAVLLLSGLFALYAQTPGQQVGEPSVQTVSRTSGKTLSLDEVLSGLGSAGDAEFRWDPFFKTGVFVVQDHSAVFEAGNPGENGLLLFDGREIYTLPAPYLEGGSLFFPEIFAASLQNAFTHSREDDASRFRIAAIIVDPGHGGKDSGAVGDFTVNGKPLKSVEKDITLKVSKNLHSLLSAAYPDKRIMLTREGDTYPTLENRVDLAHSVPLRENEAIVFVSIHANASFNNKARGFEVWYLRPEYRRTVIDMNKYDDSSDIISIRNAMLEEEFTTESIMMARSIVNRLSESIGKDMPSRGIKAEEWFVVRNARMPSVLIELGFVTNQEDAVLMSDEGHLRKTGEAIYKGISDFIADFERSGGFTAIQ
jgi:N-acetylmuramoyl-L-alanine amidase